MSVTTDAAAIRPFEVDFPPKPIADLRRRIQATRWPERETVAGHDPGRAARDDARSSMRYWGTEYDFGRVAGAAERAPAVHDRDRRSRHPLHPRRVAARERAAADHHARLAGLGRRDAERRSGRSADPTAHGGDAADAFDVVVPVDARLRVLGQADGDRLGPRPHRACLDRADEAPRIHAIRRAGRRLGCPDHGRDGRQGTSGAARHPLEHARHGAAGRRRRRLAGERGAVRVCRPRRPARGSA